MIFTHMKMVLHCIYIVIFSFVECQSNQLVWTQGKSNSQQMVRAAHFACQIHMLELQFGNGSLDCFANPIVLDKHLTVQVNKTDQKTLQL